MLHTNIPGLEEFKVLAQVKGETCVSLPPSIAAPRSIAPPSRKTPVARRAL